MNTILTIENLSVNIKDKPILNQLNFSVQAGEIIGIIGSSGVGKSTLLFAIAGLLNEQYTLNGNILFPSAENSLALTKKARQRLCAKHCNLVFQNALNSLDPYEKIAKQLEELILFKENQKQTEQRISQLLNLVGLEKEQNILHKYPHQISGGMAQKICLALAFIGNPSILLADEPSSSMDALYQLEFVKQLSSIAKKENIALLFVSHDFALISNFCERIIVLDKGIIVEDDNTAKIIRSPKANATKTILNASRKMLLYENH